MKFKVMKYEKRGVSADKKDVHEAIKHLDKGLYPQAFCKILPDFLYGDEQYALIMHADTAGTKTSLAYLYWKETGDENVWEGIVQDAIVMNIDDLACSGAASNFILSSTIGRNKNLISGEVISRVINAQAVFAEKLKKFGINIYLAGGETADVGDIVRTIDVGITVATRIKRNEVIEIRPQPGDVIVGFASFGQSIYEDGYNSGIGSNGLTFARHEVLNKYYAEKYPESYDPALSPEVIYSGKMFLTDNTGLSDINVGRLLLSPTRTYLPLLQEILFSYRSELHGIVHCTGGGQTKILHFIDNLKIVKNNLFEIPPVFRLIQQQNDTPLNEMFKVFNMGHRLEIYCHPDLADKLIAVSGQFGIEARIIGHVEESSGKEVVIHYAGEEFTYF
ncbi:MAG: phosphoribosylformylglycinamidine cyclo-ligase [Sphingobacteriales bacterium]|nr:phosphoribosylformylglycinamidine cyclo-ligase [Sphingobacteriales bacterium]